MTEFELLTQVALARETSGRVMEYFVTASSAVVVGSFFARKYVSLNMSRYISAAYLVSVVFCVLGQIDPALRIAHYVSVLNQLGADTSHIVNARSYIQMVSTILLHSLVAGGTLYFSWFMMGRESGEVKNA